MANRPESKEPQSERRLGKTKARNAVVAIMLVLGAAAAIFLVYQHWQEQRIVIEAQESAQRQDRQHMQEELEAIEHRQPGECSDESAAAQTQAFSGTLLESSYRERATEVQAPAEEFPNASVLLLQLSSPTSAIGYSAGDAAPTERTIGIVRVPDDLGINGDLITVEIDESVYWPSDISGVLWDLDLSESRSLKATSL